MDEKYYNAIKTAKRENYEKIYLNDKLDKQYTECIEPMFFEVYEKLYDDLIKKDRNSVIFTHHIDFVNKQRSYYCSKDYMKEDPDNIVVDFIASMTDDYFIDLYNYLFANGKHKIEYVPYF